MDELRPQSSKHHKKRSTFYIPEELKHCTHVIVRHDATKAPFAQPYDGPFKILERHDKFLKLKLNSRVDNISIDRLKPAFLETVHENFATLEPRETSASTSKPPRSYSDIVRGHGVTDIAIPVLTRSGRNSRTTQRYGI